MNRIVHWELQTTDPQKAKNFYEPLFGWKLDYMKDMNYVVVKTEDRPDGVGPDGVMGVGGGMTIVKQVQPSGTILYVGVDEIDTTLKKAEKLGAKVVTPKSPIPTVGFFGMLLDPEGNKIGLFTPEKKS